MGQTMLAAEPRHVQEETPGLVGRYLRFCARHLCELDAYIAHHDVTAVCRIAHILRGNAHRIGLSELSSLGRQLEEYCLGRDWSAIDSAYQAIAETLEKLCDGTPVPVSVEFDPNRRVEALEVKRTA